MLITSLALKVYHDENGSYPSSLGALVPKYLIKIPSDPFAASGSIKYLKSGSGYALYSVGPDGTDDHGKPISKTAGGTLPVVLPDSKGDIVAGINP